MSGVLGIATGTGCLTAVVALDQDRRPIHQDARAPSESMVAMLQWLNGEESSQREFDRYMARLRYDYTAEAQHLVKMASTYHLALAVPRFPPDGLRASAMVGVGTSLTALHPGQQPWRGGEAPEAGAGVSNHVLLPVGLFHDVLRRKALAAGLAAPWVDPSREVYFRCPLCLRADPTNRHFGEFHCRACMREPVKDADLVVAWNTALDYPQE